jgi:hypothetical protein
MTAIKTRAYRLQQGAVKSLPAPTPCSDPDGTPGSSVAPHSAMNMPSAAAAGSVPGADGPAAAAAEAAASWAHVQPKQGVRQQAGQLRARLRAGSVAAAACLALLVGAAATWGHTSSADAVPLSACGAAATCAACGTPWHTAELMHLLTPLQQACAAMSTGGGGSRIAIRFNARVRECQCPARDFAFCWSYTGMGIGVAGALILGFTINGRGFDALSFFLFAVLVGGFLTILFGCLCVKNLHHRAHSSLWRLTRIWRSTGHWLLQFSNRACRISV